MRQADQEAVSGSSGSGAFVLLLVVGAAGLAPTASRVLVSGRR
jgi:hypothetical protein